MMVHLKRIARYKTNKYNLTLGFFCGTNHRKKTMIFANDFLFKENTESFVWCWTRGVYKGNCSMMFLIWKERKSDLENAEK